MQGQGSSSNSFPGNIYFNGGLGSNQHNVVPDALVHDGHTSMRWNGQSSSNRETQNHVVFGFNPFLENISMNTGNIGHVSSENVPIGPSLSPEQEAGSGPDLQHNLDLNAVPEGNGIDASQDNGPYLSLDLLRSGTSSGDQIPTSGGSSSPVMIYSGIAGYVLEENINLEGLPTDSRRRLLCKRRAPEFPSGQVTSGDSSSSALQAGISEQPGVINSLNAASSFNNPTPSNFHQIPNEVGQVDNFQRNTRLRRTASQQNPAPANYLRTWNSSNCNVQATGQRSVFSPFNPFIITSSAPAPVLVNPTMQPIVRVSNSLQAPHPSQYWNGTTMSPVGSSSFSPHQTVNVREDLAQEVNVRNNRRTMMIPLAANMQANLNLANGNAYFLGNIASSSRIQSGSGMHLPNMAEQYAQRMRYFVDRSEAWRLGNYCPIHSGASPAVRDMDVTVRGGNVRPAQVPLRLGATAERQAGHHSEVSPTVLFQTAAQRSRLVYEVRNALGLVRRAGGLRFEDVMVIDRSFLYGMPEEADIQDDMRLDVDNMSYEELLDLEEQIGDVCTGLSEESILANLRRRKYQSITIGPPVEAESCCICQEDYANGEELGKLDCGHDFHFNCIKQWLVQKNSCPVCKKTALAI